MAEKILNHAAGRDDGVAGDIVNARVSHLMTNDAFDGIGASLWDRRRISVVLDHNTPATTENAARVHNLLRCLAREHGVHRHAPTGCGDPQIFVRPRKPGALFLQ